MRTRLLVWAAAMAVAALAATACGSDDAATVGGADGPAAAGDVPDLEMVDVRTDSSVSLQAVADGSTPLLLWFWVPH